MYGVEEVTHLFDRVADENCQKIISVLHTVADTCDDGIYVFQYGSIFNTCNILATGVVQILVLKYGGESSCILDIRASQRDIGQPFESDLFGMARTADDSDIVNRDIVVFGKIIGYEHVFVRNDSFDGRNDEFVLHGGRHLHQMLFQKRRRGGENQSVRIFDYFVDIRVEFDFVSIKFDGGKIAGVMSQQQKLFYLVWPTHIPVNTILCRKYNLGQGGSPATTSHYCNFSGQLHSITLIWLRLQSMPLLLRQWGFAIPVCISYSFRRVPVSACWD